MRILAMHKTNSHNEAGHAPPPEMMAAMGQLVGSMMQRGILVATEGLCPSAQGARARFTNGSRKVTDGPFTEAKELIAGYAVLEAPSVKAAIDLSVDFAKIIGDVEIDFLPIVAMEAR